MERVIINTMPRSGGTVYLAQYWHARGWQTFDEPWGGRLRDQGPELQGLRKSQATLVIHSLLADVSSASEKILAWFL